MPPTTKKPSTPRGDASKTGGTPRTGAKATAAKTAGGGKATEKERPSGAFLKSDKGDKPEKAADAAKDKTAADKSKMDSDRKGELKRAPTVSVGMHMMGSAVTHEVSQAIDAAARAAADAAVAAGYCTKEQSEAIYSAAANAAVASLDPSGSSKLEDVSGPGVAPSQKIEVRVRAWAMVAHVLVSCWGASGGRAD